MQIKNESVEQIKNYILKSTIPSCDAQALVALLVEEVIEEK
jgi:hypothetical protein